MRYCLRNCVCRFGFPRPFSQLTEIVVKDVLYKRGEKKGNIKNTAMEMVFSSNDAWMNSHSTFALTAWAANIDMSLIIDSYGVVDYIAKYVNKVEAPSQALQTIVHEGIRINQEEKDDTANVKSILRRTINRLTGRRDKCLMEVCHSI